MTKFHQYIDQNKRVYNAIATHFSDTRSFVWNDIIGLERFTVPGNTILDVGCGNGRLYQLFSKMQVQYIGIDQSEGLITIARKKFPLGRFLLGTMNNTALSEGSIDVIYAIASFHHLPTVSLRVQALQEMKRILKPNGTIIMLNWNLYSNWAREKYQGDEHSDFLIPWKDGDGKILGTRYYHGFLLEELHELAEQAGLSIVEQHYIKKGKVSSIGPGENIFTRMTVM